jgi:TolB protein
MGRPEGALFLVAALALATSGCTREPEHRAPVDAGAAPPRPPSPSAQGSEAESSPSPNGSAPTDPDPIPEAERRGIPGWIAFLSERDGKRHVYLIRPSGEEERRLTRSPENEYPAAPAPDGAALLIIAVEDDAQRQLHLEQLVVQPLDGGPGKGIGPRGGRDRSPSWSPDGRWIVFESDVESFSDIYRVSRDGSGLTRLTRNAQGNFEPALSPDGTQIAFVSSRDGDPELYRMRADGTKQQRLTAFHSEDWGPRWSPDGKRLAFLSDRGGRARIHVVNADGTHLRTLAGPPPEVAGRGLPSPGDAGAARPAPGPPGTSEEESDPTWSPDGTQLAYITRRAGTKARIWIVDLAAGDPRPLTDGTHGDEAPAWSPDGRYLAFTSDRAGDTELYLMRADGTGQTRLTRAKGADWLPRWVPPGRR